MNKQELIKKIAGNEMLGEIATEAILDAADDLGWLRNPGEPIDPKDIRKGDRVRTEYAGGDVLEEVARIHCPYHASAPAEYFLLDRPKPELPTEAGSVIRVTFPHEPGRTSCLTLGRDGHWWRSGGKWTAMQLAGIEFEVVA